MEDTIHISISEHHLIESIPLGKTEIDGDKFTAHFSRALSTDGGTGPWHLGLLLEPSFLRGDDGCDVEEMPEDYAIQILGNLFNVHVYNEKTHTSVF